MLNLAEVAAELDSARAKAHVAFSRKDLSAYMSLFSPELRYQQADGKVIGRRQLERDVRAQFSRINETRSTFEREEIKLDDGRAIEVGSQSASGRETAFFLVHRVWDVSRTARYVWNRDHGQWQIAEVEVIDEVVKSRGFTFGLRPPSLD
jgi:hypothetical protein